MELKIDYSNIQKTEVASKTSYRAPRHVFFGKRGEDGMMEEEPKYIHQEYPKMLYRLLPEDNGVIKVCIVNADTERDAQLADGWATNPKAFGYLTAPSFEEHLAMKKAITDAKAEKPLDHVEDDELVKARAEYEAKFGKRPHHKKTVESLRAELAA